MSEEAKVFAIRRVFVKDLSFERPAAADPAPTNSKVKMSVTVGFEHSQRDHDGLWDVTLGITLHATDHATGDTHFIVEAKQGALFEISGVSEEERERLLTTECQEAVFPFIRTLIWSIGVQGGLRGMLLKAMEFDELYRQATETGAPASASVTH